MTMPLSLTLDSATDWQQVLNQLVTLWAIGWGLRAVLVGLLLGGAYWFWRNHLR